MAKPSSEQGLLAGLRVLDLADEKASFASKLLAEMGAEVIKLERPGGDPARGAGPQLKKTAGSAGSLSFAFFNANKKSITLNLEMPQGRELFKRLAQWGDVVVETHRPGTLDRLGLGYGVLSRINPRLILASVTGYGQTGPKKYLKSCDLVASASGGQMAVSGDPDSQPLKRHGVQSYLTASLYAAVAILLAVRKRRRTGRGEHIDISIQEAVISTTEHLILGYFYNGLVPKRQGGWHWNHLFCLLPCRDGFIQMTLGENWETLVEWLDGEGLAGDLTDPRWRQLEYRLEHREHVLGVLEKWTRKHSREELFRLGQLMRFPWAPVQTPAEILNCPQLEARAFFREVEQTELLAGLKHPRLPFVLSGPETVPLGPAPAIGQDNLEVYRDQLNLSEEQLELLKNQGVI